MWIKIEPRALFDLLRSYRGGRPGWHVDVLSDPDIPLTDPDVQLNHAVIDISGNINRGIIWADKYAEDAMRLMLGENID